MQNNIDSFHWARGCISVEDSPPVPLIGFIDLLQRWLLRDDKLWHCREPPPYSCLKLHFSGISCPSTPLSEPGSCEGRGKRSHSNRVTRSHGGFYFSWWHNQCHEQHGGPNCAAKAWDWRKGGRMWEWGHGTQHHPRENPWVLPNVWHREQGLHHPTRHAGEVAGMKVTAVLELVKWCEDWL